MKPTHGEHAVCGRCQGDIEFFEESAGNGDVLNSWWAHAQHPTDGHDAEPALPESPHRRMKREGW